MVSFKTKLTSISACSRDDKRHPTRPCSHRCLPSSSRSLEKQKRYYASFKMVSLSFSCMSYHEISSFPVSLSLSLSPSLSLFLNFCHVFSHLLPFSLIISHFSVFLSDIHSHSHRPLNLSHLCSLSFGFCHSLPSSLTSSCSFINGFSFLLLSLCVYKNLDV